MRHTASPWAGSISSALEQQIEALAPATGKAPAPRRAPRPGAAPTPSWRASATDAPAAPLPPRPMPTPLRPPLRKMVAMRQPAHDAMTRETRLAAQDRESADGAGAPRTGSGPLSDVGAGRHATEQEGGGGGGDGEGEPGGGAAAGWATGAADGAHPDDLSPAALAALLPGAQASGVFEVVLPDGDTLAVVVDAGPQVVSYLLQAGSEQLAARLQRGQMELTAQVERRIGRSVRLTVL